jgi:hypothetical protein
VVGFDRDLWTILGGKLGALDEVSFCAVPFDDRHIVILIQDGKSEAVDKEVNAFGQFEIEYFWDETL